MELVVPFLSLQCVIRIVLRGAWTNFRNLSFWIMCKFAVYRKHCPKEVILCAFTKPLSHQSCLSLCLCATGVSHCPTLLVLSFSLLKPTTCCQAVTTYSATIRTASFASVLSATLELKPRASPRNSQGSSLLSPPWRATSACPSFVTTSCLEVRAFDLHRLLSAFYVQSRRSPCQFTLIGRDSVCLLCAIPTLIFVYG